MRLEKSNDFHEILLFFRHPTPPQPFPQQHRVSPSRLCQCEKAANARKVAEEEAAQADPAAEQNVPDELH